MPESPKLLIDTNILALLIVGMVSADHIEKCNRIKRYSKDDFTILTNYVSRFSTCIVTPNVATETNNLINTALHGKYLTTARQLLANALQKWDEIYIKSIDASSHPDYLNLGLTDVGILLAANSEVEVLTDDFGVYGKLSGMGLPAVNFNHLRTENM